LETTPQNVQTGMEEIELEEELDVYDVKRILDS
jgi:hypothetical protein